MTQLSDASAVFHIAETDIAGPHGRIRVRTYIPSKPRASGIVWIHGGGFFLNDIDVPEAHWVASEFAAQGIVVVSPDYRLANDGIHFPVLSDECRTAWEWAQTNPDLANVAEWHLGGGSAGGNLAAAVAMELRDSGASKQPVSNVLVYPAMHSRFPEPSVELSEKLRTLPPDELYTPDQMLQVALNYVGDEALLEHPRAFPGYGHLEDMPPTLIVNSEFDPIRASGEDYGSLLVSSGVDTVVIREPEAHHGHLNYPTHAAARRTVQRMIAWMQPTLLRGTRH